MGPDDEVVENAIQALLDGRALCPSPSGTVPGSIEDPLQVVDAIARVHRTALFGSDAPLDPVVATRWGHLDVRGEIGRGASGTVYRAWDSRLAREVALKLFGSDADAAAVLQEGRLLARLNHPHIVKVFGADTHDGVPGVWMELLEGETLDEILVRDGPFGCEDALLIGLDVARALSAVHSAGMLHRDIKTRNVLRERGGRVVVTDLGAGRATDSVPIHGDGTGTPMYMAPEVLAGGAASVRSEVYSLGVLLYRLLTRSFPVMATDLVDLRAAHATGRRVPLASLRPDLSPMVVATIERGSHPDPEARYANAAELEGALADGLQRTLLERASVASPTARRMSRWRTRALAVTATMAVTFLTAAVSWETGVMRAARRAVGFTVPPRSPLYLTLNGGLVIVRGRTLTIVPHNPSTATVLAVSSDLGIVTMSGMPPWTDGASFRLDGTPIAAAPMRDAVLCCFGDGTTDGQFNYSPRQDSTLLAPIGSRPLAPAALYRFDRDWSKPRVHFPLQPTGLYSGVAYSRVSQSFWLTRITPGGSVIEQWSRDGRLLSTPVSIPAAALTGLAIDPRDGTLWVIRVQSAAVSIRLQNFDMSGRHLATLDLEPSPITIGAAGAEFAFNPSS